MYAVIENSQITGFTSHPNETSSTPVDEQSAEWLDYLLSQNRRVKTAEIKREALTRISQQVSALNSIEMVELMVELWPMLDVTSASPEMTAAKDIYQYAKGQIQTVNSATQAQLDAYDPATDPNWP